MRSPSIRRKKSTTRKLRVFQFLTETLRLRKGSPPLMRCARAGGSQSEPAVSQKKAELFRCHANCTIKPNTFAVQHLIHTHMLHQCCKFIRPPKAGRKRHGNRQSLNRFFRQGFKQRCMKQARKNCVPDPALLAGSCF